MADGRADTHLRRLGEIVRAGLQALRQLSAIMADERAALERRDADALQENSVVKRQCLETLETLERQRARCLAESGNAVDAPGMQDFLDACNDDALAAGWQEFLSLARQCSTANLTNGAIIRARQQQVSAIMTVLAGASPGPTYGPGGSRQPAAGSRPLGAA